MSYSSSSSYHPSSKGPRGTGPRLWPLVLLAVLLGSVALVGGVALGRGESPLSWFDGLRSNENSGGEVAQTDPPVDEAPVVIESATDVPTATAAPTEEAQGPDPNAPAVAPPTETPLPEEATAAPDTTTDSPTDVVQAFSQLWADGDYDGMYNLLTTSARAKTKRQDFIDRYQGISDEAGLTGVSVKMSGQSNLDTQVPIKVTFTPVFWAISSRTIRFRPGRKTTAG